MVYFRARWPSGRASDSGARGRGFDTYLRRVVSLSKDTFTPRKVLVISRKRWLRPDMTEKLLTGMLSLNKTKPNMVYLSFCLLNIHVFELFPVRSRFIPFKLKNLSFFRMSQIDVRNYLEKIYKVPVIRVATEVREGMFNRHKSLKSSDTQNISVIMLKFRANHHANTSI